MLDWTRCRLFAASLAGAALLAFGGAPAMAVNDEGPLCEPTEYNIWAGQDINVGTVTVTPSETSLTVEWELDDPWYADKAQWHVATTLAGIPTNQQGIPVPGQFDNQEAYDPPVQSDSFEVLFDDYGVEPGDKLYIALHLEVVKIVDDEIVQGETAWGGDEPGPGRRWWFYIEYKIPECEDNGNGETTCETAYAEGDNRFDQIGLRNWGWTIGAFGAFDGERTSILWAGAGQHNDNNEGTNVGDFRYSYASVSDTQCRFDGAVEVAAPFTLDESHLYLNTSQLATQAPGQFENNSIGDRVLDGPISYSVLVDKVDGECPSIYVAAHAAVCGIPKD